MNEENAREKFEQYLKDGNWKYTREEGGAYVGIIKFDRHKGTGYARFCVTFESGCICNVAYYQDSSPMVNETLSALELLKVNREILWGAFDVRLKPWLISYKIVFPFRSVDDACDFAAVFDDVMYIPCAMGSAYLDRIISSDGQGGAGVNSCP